MRIRAVYWLLLVVAGFLVGYYLEWPGTTPEPALPPFESAVAQANGATTEAATSSPVTEAAAAAVPVQTELGRGERNNVAVYQQASAAVVNITTRTVEMDFFRRAIPREGSGSGFLIDQRGHIVTNHHVVANAGQIQVTLADRSSFEAKVVGLDPLTDLAVLRIDPGARRLPTLPLGDSSRLQVGQKVLAIGNPFGFQGTLTTGVISALERSLENKQGGLLDEAIQTDAAINSGNSGGPLLDSQGQVIGVNSMIFTPSGGSVGIGFSIPVNTVKFVVNDLIRFGKVRRGWLGISGLEIWPDLAEALDLPVDRGVLVERLVRGATADQAGLRGGDRWARWGRYRFRIGGDLIVTVNGKPVKKVLDVNRLIYKKRPGETVEIEFYRGRRKRSARVKLQERP